MTTPDDDLRQLFSDATSDIRPQGSLDDILDRTKKVDPMARRWFLPVIAAAAVMALAIGGAVWLAKDSNSPQGSQDPISTPTPTAGVDVSERAVPMYFVGEAAQGKRLFREFQKLQTCASTDCLLFTAVRHSLSGGAQDPDYSSLWTNVDVKGTSFTDDLITIDLPASTHDRPSAMTAADADLAIQQAIFTAQAAVGKGRLPVKFTIDGGPTDTVLGVPTSEPLAAGAELDVLAPVQISSPVDGTTMKAGDLKVTGVAAAFEANVQWELLVGGDAVAVQGHATAAECCKLSPYSFTIEHLQPGSYTLVVHDEDMSGEGRPINQDTKDIVVE